MLLLLCGVNELTAQDKLWYNKPAINFNEALPIGNGRIGAMVYGRVQDEYISLNEGSLWSGGPNIKWNNPEAKQYLPLVRAAALAGEYKKADSLAKFMQGPWTESFMPMADLHIRYNNIKDSTNYKRTLDLSTAVCTTNFSANGMRYERSAFASFPGNVLVLRQSASKAGAVSFVLQLSSKLRYKLSVHNNEIILNGKCPKHAAPAYLWKIKDGLEYDADPNGEGMTFQVRLQIKHEGGKINATDSTLTVNNADAVTILITAATSFNGFDKSPGLEGKDPSVAAAANMQKAAALSYPQLLARHLKDYQSIYQRVHYDFGESSNSQLPTDERLQQMPEQPDAALLATIAQYGRYILIASSRPGGQPSNLKGIWNEKPRPEYSSNWCIDHDAQMSYYPVETNNLSEMHLPFLQLIVELSQNGYKTAAINYGMKGWCAHHNTDIWRKSSPVGNFGEGNPHWANWNMSGPWLSSHFFNHYLFTGDKQFLKEKAWPVMKGAALFCLDWLIKDDKGQLISVPSVSPENTFITAANDTCMVSVNATGDIELMKDLFKNCMAAAKVLNIKDGFTDSVAIAYSKLAPYPIGSKGQLLEWQQEWKAMDPAHRHLTHMYALYPGSEISYEQTPELADAFKKALPLREKTNGSWGFAWKAACWARLNEADSAWQTLSYQLRYVDAQSKSSLNNLGLYPNLFNSEVPAVILNGNTCITAVITEMLMQSHTGTIHLLPALPAVIKTGAVKGLCAQAGFVVDMQWKDKELVKAVIHSKLGNTCRVLLPAGYKIFAGNKEIVLKNEGRGRFSFKTVKGKHYIISK